MSTDNQLLAALRDLLTDRLGLIYPGSNIQVKQRYQPTQQGVPTGPIVYMHKVAEKRFGWPQRKDEYRPDLGVLVHVESIQMETTYQIGAIIPADPTDLSKPTSGDITKRCAIILQADFGLRFLRARGIGVLRVSDIRAGYDVDDRENFEAEPSFDVVLTHRDTTTDDVGTVTGTEVEIFRV